MMMVLMVLIDGNTTDDRFILLLWDKCDRQKGRRTELCHIPHLRAVKLRYFKTRVQQLLRWATVPEQSGPKCGGCCAPFRVRSWVLI